MFLAYSIRMNHPSKLLLAYFPILIFIKQVEGQINFCGPIKITIWVSILIRLGVAFEMHNKVIFMNFSICIAQLFYHLKVLIIHLLAKFFTDGKVLSNGDCAISRGVCFVEDLAQCLKNTQLET